MLLAPLLISKHGKRNLLILCNLVNIVLLTILLPTFKSLLVVCIIFYLNAFVNTFGNIYFPNINADMRDYHQWKTGVRVDGLFAPLALIGTFLGFFTGLVVPSIYQYMGIEDDYSVLYNDALRNNLFKVLIICSIVGAVLNLIPYLFYDLTESKHRGYVYVLKIRAMFEDYAQGNLDENELKESMKIINTARELDGQKKRPIDKTALRQARSMPSKTPEEKEARRQAVREAREQIKAEKVRNQNIESMPIVIEELEKFSTARYQNQLENAEKTCADGELHYYENANELIANAKMLPKETKQEREIRSDEIRLARMKKKSSRLIKKYGESLVKPDDEVENEIKEREIGTVKENIQAKRDLKKYVKAKSLYYRAIAPYTNAKNLLVQAENYTHLSEIEKLHESICK